MASERDLIPRRGAEFQIGDVLEVFGKRYTITGFDDHPGMAGPLFDGDEILHYTARKVLSALDWSMTVFDDDVWWLKAPGVWVWFQSEALAGDVTAGATS